MTAMHAPGTKGPRQSHAAVGSVLLCITGGIALAVAMLHLDLGCREGTHASCPNGSPSFELVFQVVLAGVGLATAFAVRHFVNRHAYARARAASVVTILLLAIWLVLVDLLNDGLQVPFFLLTIVLISLPLALFAAVIRHMR
jgi:hypothetical protein